jgi:hypothetical protein
MDVGTREGLVEMLEEIEKAGKQADAGCRDWQLAIKPGDFVLLLDSESGLTVYGEILDPAANGNAPAEASRSWEGDAFYSGPGPSRRVTGYRFGRWWSAACPDGEYGSNHAWQIATTMSREEFEEARRLGWPAATRLKGEAKLDAVFWRAVEFVRSVIVGN